MNFIKSAYAFYLRTLAMFEWLPALLTRICVGFVFAETGLGKVQHLDKTIEFFKSLHIPAPELQAPFVACVELIGGMLLIVGLGTRIVALPLIGTMVVAILTALRSDIESASDLFALSEFLFIVLFIWLAVKGPGRVSIDAWIANKTRSS